MEEGEGDGVEGVRVGHRGVLYSKGDGTVAAYWRPSVDDVKEAYAAGEIEDDKLDEVIESAINGESILLWKRDMSEGPR